MKTTTLVIGSIGVIFISLFLIAVTFTVSYNSMAGLKNTYDHKLKTNQAEFDNMWKKIREVAEVPEQKKAALMEVLASYTSGRQVGQQQLMTWVQEAVPSTAGLDVYDKVMNMVAGSRDTWTMKQSELVSVAEQYNARMVKFPSNIIAGVMGFQVIDPQIITSTRTTTVFENGKDDEVGVFGR